MHTATGNEINLLFYQIRFNQFPGEINEFDEYCLVYFDPYISEWIEIFLVSFVHRTQSN